MNILSLPSEDIENYYVAPAESSVVDECSQHVLCALYKAGTCQTIAQLRSALSSKYARWIPIALAFLQVDGYIGRHTNVDQLAHYFLTTSGIQLAEAN